MEYIKFYCNNNNKELNRVSDYVINKYFGWLSQMYYDDFYSIANEVLWRCCENYRDDMGAQFETYLISCLIRKFKTRITYMNRQRRNNGNQEVSLDTLIDDNDNCLMSMIASDCKIEFDSYSDKMINYLKRLSKRQKQVLFAMSEGYSNDEIKARLKISQKELSDACTALRSYRNVSILY